MKNSGAIFLAVFISIFCLALPSVVYAYKVGNVDVYITGNLSETFDDNITEAKDNKEEDFITNVGMGLLSTYEGKNTTFDCALDVTQHFFAHNSDFNNTSVDFATHVTQDITESDRITAADTFVHAQDPVDLQAEFGRIPGRYSYNRNDFSLEYSHDFSSQLTVNSHYLNQLYIPSGDDSSDSYLNQFGIGADYSLSSATVLLFGYDYFQRNFYPGESAFFNDLTAGLRQYFTKQLYLEGKAGVQLIHSFNDENLAKPLITASLVGEISENTKWSLTYEKKYATDPYTQDIFDSWQVYTQVERELTQRSTLALSGFYGQGTYPDFDEDVNYTGLVLGFGYSIKENIKATASYAYTQTDSNVPDRVYLRNTFELGIKVKF